MFNSFSVGLCPLRSLRGTCVVAALFLVAHCGELRGQDEYLAVAWNDFNASSGMLQAFSTTVPWEVVRDPIPIGLNSVIEPAFGKLFVLSPTDSTVQVVDPLSWMIEQTHVLQPGLEPIDIQVVSPQLAYVSRRNATHLLELNLVTGMTQDGTDLSVLADNDGIPDQGTMAVYEGRLFLQLQRTNFDEPPPFPQPYVAVVDVASGELIDVDPVQDGLQAIELAGTFPKMRMQVVDETRELFVSATGAFFDDGGIEVIDLDSLQSNGLAIREDDGLTGADLGAFVMVTPDEGFLVFSTDLLLSSHLHQFSLSGGVDPAELAVALDYFSPAIEFHAGTNAVFLPVGGSVENGFHVFDATTGAMLNSRLVGTAGPPSDLVVIAVVPEPAGLWLVLIASVTLVQRKRRRKHQSTE
jgi:hypothetical protein